MISKAIVLFFLAILGLCTVLGVVGSLVVMGYVIVDAVRGKGESNA